MDNYIRIPCENGILTQSHNLNPIENLGRELKIALHRRSPSHLTEVEQIYKEEWENIRKSRCAKLIQTDPRRLGAVIAAKGTSPKY